MTISDMDDRELLRRFPELAGVSSEDVSMSADLYGQPGMPRIGAIPPPIPPEVRDRENAEREARYNAGEASMRRLIEGAARAAGADPATATRTADSVLRLVPQQQPAQPAEPEPAEPVQDDPESPAAAALPKRRTKPAAGSTK